jgi:hypothetical protein
VHPNIFDPKYFHHVTENTLGITPTTWDHFVSLFVLISLVFFETGWLEHLIHLTHLPKYWDYKSTPPPQSWMDSLLDNYMLEVHKFYQVMFLKGRSLSPII